MAATLAVLALLTPAAFADADITFGAAPAPGSMTKDGYFAISAQPGAVVRQQLRVTNNSRRQGVVRLAATDAVTGAHGGVIFPNVGDPVSADGQWVQVSSAPVTLAGGESRDVPVLIRIPTSAVGGVHLAGLIAYTAADQKVQPSQAASGTRAVVIIKSRLAVAVQVTLPGAAAPELRVTGVTTQARPDGLALVVAVTNAGTGLTKGTGTLSLTGPQAFKGSLTLDTVVPRTSFSYPIPWTASPANGHYSATVDITYDGGRHARFSGGFDIGAREQQALNSRVEGRRPSTATSATPWWRISDAIAGGAGGLALLALLALVLRRRRPGLGRHGRHGG